jgi:hypothetical protein
MDFFLLVIYKQYKQWGFNVNNENLFVINTYFFLHVHIHFKV